jgi:hypothetical protein
MFSAEQKFSLKRKDRLEETILPPAGRGIETKSQAINAIKGSFRGGPKRSHRYLA